MKKKIDLSFACVDCGKQPTPIEKKGNWDVLPVKCPECGGKIRPKVK